jgi:hypothetical protein
MASPDEYDPGFSHLNTDIVIGGECTFCDDPCDGVIEDGEFLPLVTIEVEPGTRSPVCDKHWAVILEKADLSKVVFEHGFCLLHG